MANNSSESGRSNRKSVGKRVAKSPGKALSKKSRSATTGRVTVVETKPRDTAILPGLVKVDLEPGLAEQLRVMHDHFTRPARQQAQLLAAVAASRKAFNEARKIAAHLAADPAHKEARRLAALLADDSAIQEVQNLAALLVGDQAAIAQAQELFSCVSAALERGDMVLLGGQIDAELTSQEVADLINVSRPHVVKLARNGELAHRMVGNRHRFRLSDVQEYAAARHADREEALAALIPEGGYADGDF